MSSDTPKPAPAKAAPKAAPKPVPQAAAATGAAATAAVGGRPGKAVGVREEMAEREELGGFNVWLRDAIHQTPSWAVSGVVHMIVLLILALTFIATQEDGPQALVVAPGDDDEIEDIEEFEEFEDFEEVDVDVMPVETEAIVPEEVEVAAADDMEAAPMYVELSEFGITHAPRNALTDKIGSYSGTGLDGRGKNRAMIARKAGGSAGSEKAVGAALKWLANHQMPDGGWSFDHRLSPLCQGKCGNPGSDPKARNAATALALLPFLGAGQTHMEGNYKDTVNRGLYYLCTKMKHSPQGGSLHEPGGRMYSHGLGAIALCEAYAMTHDKSLYAPAQASLNFICYAQDPAGGGWRYEPRQAGDTSVVGWQLMALKSGHMAYLRVQPGVVQKAFGFLDQVQGNSGATYGYTPGRTIGDATTAIGLLCRMYLGWKQDNPALQRGIEILSKKGPAIQVQGKELKSANMYYNYYATQVMRHNEGEKWKKWNSVMRDSLVNTQAGPGSHEEGSWYCGGGHGAKAGRLYTTAMATMILEVYYRHLPIYRKQSTEEEFPE